MTGRLPDFVIVGAPRSGTTTLNSHLREHPGVFMSPSKELHFFDKQWDKGLDWYRSQFEDAPESVPAGEATPHYMSDPRAMERLDQALPQADLIAILRHPVDRAHSHFHYRCARGLDSGDLARAVERELSGEPGAYPYLAQGRYAEQLGRIDSLSGSHRVLTLWFDDLASEPSKVLTDLADFLGLEPFDTHDVTRVVNSADSFRSVRLRRAGKRLPAPLRGLIGRVNRKEAPYPPAPPELRVLMVEALGDDIAHLEERTGRSLASWRS